MDTIFDVFIKIIITIVLSIGCIRFIFKMALDKFTIISIICVSIITNIILSELINNFFVAN